MQTKLTVYIKDLKQSYDLIDGKKGKAILASDYAEALLLQEQLNTPEN